MKDDPLRVKCPACGEYGVNNYERRGVVGHATQSRTTKEQST